VSQNINFSSVEALEYFMPLETNNVFMNIYIPARSVILPEFAIQIKDKKNPITGLDRP
jgi:hypothetical protein